MKRDLINYSLLVLLGIILLISFMFNYKDFDHYFEKTISAETEQEKKENFREAMDAWKESDGKAKKATAYLYMGYYYFQLEKYEESIKEFDAGIKITPNFLEIYLARGIAYRRLNKLKMSLSDFDKAVELDPRNPNVLLDRGWTYHKLKDYDKACSNYDKALDYSKYLEKSEIFRSKGILFLEMGKPESALESLRQSFKLKKDTFTILLSVIAGSAISENEYRNEKQKLLEVRPKNDWERSLLKFYRGNITEETLLSEAEKAPNQKKVREKLCEAYYYAGKQAQYKGDKKKAKEFFELSLKQNIPEFIENGLSEAELKRSP